MLPELIILSALAIIGTLLLVLGLAGAVIGWMLSPILWLMKRRREQKEYIEPIAYVKVEYLDNHVPPLPKIRKKKLTPPSKPIILLAPGNSEEYTPDYVLNSPEKNFI